MKLIFLGAFELLLMFACLRDGRIGVRGMSWPVIDREKDRTTFSIGILGGIITGVLLIIFGLLDIRGNQ